jgi:hypothetical protein
MVLTVGADEAVRGKKDVFLAWWVIDTTCAERRPYPLAGAFNEALECFLLLIK